MSLLIEVGRWIKPNVEETLFGQIVHVGWVSVAVFDGRLSSRLFAWRQGVEKAVQA